MAFDKRTWKDRRVEFPDRRTLVDITSQTAKTYDIQREEGVVYEAGDQLDATNFNDLEDRISNAFSDKQDKLIAGTGISIENNIISISLTDADTQEY